MKTPRQQAREAALQILYFVEVGRAPMDAAIQTFFDEHGQDASAPTATFAAELVEGVSAEAGDLDARIARHLLNWRLERLAILDRLVLRLAAWELQHELDTPAAVVIDEAIELARRFGSEDSGRFVNGVLDAIRKDLER